MELIAVKIIDYLLLPPGIMFLLIAVGLLLRRRWRRVSFLLLSSGVVLLLAASLPVVLNPLLRVAEEIPVATPDRMQHTNAQAIVVLGGGILKNVPDLNADTLNTHSLTRARYAAYAQRLSHLPILASGGSVYDNGVVEANIIKQVIETEFGGAVRWTETRSRTTYENAIYSYAMLQPENITHIILVTHALHMRRSQAVFEKAGFVVTPAPTGFHVPDAEPSYMSILPHAHHIVYSRELMHEWLGRLWYKIRY